MFVLFVDLSVDFRLVKPVNVRKRGLLVKTGENANSFAETQRYGALRMTTISNRFPTLFEVRKETFINSGDTALNPGAAEIPILLTYGRKFMCSSCTYL